MHKFSNLAGVLVAAQVFWPTAQTVAMGVSEWEALAPWTSSACEGQRAGRAKPPGGGARASGGGGGGGNRSVRRDANTNVNHNVNSNRNVNVNKNVNVNVHDDHHDGWHDDWDDHWHPVETAAAVAVTAAVVGSIVRSVPPSCTTVMANGISYSQCGSTWYQPRYSGTTVEYVVVNPPR